MIAISDNVLDFLDELSDTKKEIIAREYDSLVVSAGPGSGKTTLLTAKIATLLKDPDLNFKILALTFSNSAAEEMSTKIKEIVTDDSNKLYIGTFHSFCRKLLNHYGSYIDIIPGFSLLTTDEEILGILSEILNEYEDQLNSIHDYKVKSIEKKISFFMKNLMHPNLLTYENSNPYPVQELQIIYNTYLHRLKNLQIFSFDAILYFAFELISNFSSVRNHYQRVFRYVFIDEFQDTNPTQVELIKTLFPPSCPNKMFIVGDIDQLIYGFNGAKSESLRDFISLYDSTMEHLSTNYRCPKKIVNIANNLISKNHDRLDSTIEATAIEESDNSDNSLLIKTDFEYFDDEIEFVANDIQQNHNDDLQNVRVLARQRWLLEHVEKQWMDSGIDTKLISNDYSFQNEFFKLIYYSLKLINSNNQVYLRHIENNFSILNQYFDYISINTLQNTHGYSYANALIDYFKDKSENLIRMYIQMIDEIENGNQNFILILRNYINKFKIEFLETDNDKFVNQVLPEFKVWFELESEIVGLNSINISLMEFLFELDKRSKDINNYDDHILLNTFHSTKGSEFDHIYIIGMVEQIIPDRRNQSGIGLENERRTFYVAITRSRKTLTLTHAKKYPYFHRYKIYPPSRFLSELGV